MFLLISLAASLFAYYFMFCHESLFTFLFFFLHRLENYDFKDRLLNSDLKINFDFEPIYDYLLSAYNTVF